MFLFISWLLVLVSPLSSAIKDTLICKASVHDDALGLSGFFTCLMTTLAAVLKRKADGSPAETDEDTLKLLEDGAKELRDDFDEADKS